MIEILKNRKVLLIVTIAVLFGGFIGWLVKPSSDNHQENDTPVHQHETVDEVWTCSMHPQVRLDEPGDCPLCAMDLIPANSNRSSASSNPMVHEMTPEAVAMANIHTSRVTGMSSHGEVHLSGKIQADERQISSITAKFPSRIEQLHVNFTGQMVKSGQKLATIFSPELTTAQKELLVAASSKETFPELYAAVLEKLRLWKLTEAQINEIETIGAVRAKFDVLTDKSGVVTKRSISVGDYVNTGSVLYEVVDLSKVWILMDAYETDLPFVKVGDEVLFTTVGIPGKTFTTRVSFIDPIINSGTRTATVRAEFVNSNSELKPEMFVNARIRNSFRKGQTSLSIPRTALLWSGKRSIVYIKVPDAEYPSFEMREITLGSRMGEMYLVEAGLEAGEEIVTNGVFAIDAAAQLSGNYSLLMRPKVKSLEVSQEFLKQVTVVADAYFDVADALVESNQQGTKLAIVKMKNSVAKVNMQELQGMAHDKWMEVHKKLSEAIQMIEKADNLESQRLYFALLSEGMIEISESFGLEKDKVFKQFCPMAFDDEGGYWLSEFEEILNPYFGDAMLTCGEVVETYRRGQRVFVKEDQTAMPQSGGHNH